MKPVSRRRAPAPPAPVTPRASRQRASYQARLDAGACPVCGNTPEPGGVLCPPCRALKRHHKRAVAPRFQRTCDGPCARTLRFTPTDPRARIEHFCSACGRVTGWVSGAEARTPHHTKGSL